MRHIETFIKQQLVNLRKFRSFEFTSKTARKFAEFGSLFSTSVDDIYSSERIDILHSQILTCRHIQVESHIMTNDIFHLFESVEENIENIVKILPYIKSTFRTDTVYHRSVDRNDKTFWLDDMILSLNEFSFLIMNLPCNLYHARPIVEISQRGILI